MKLPPLADVRQPSMNRTAISVAALTDLCIRASRAQGASSDASISLASAIVAAEMKEQSSVGLTHFLDYLWALSEGRIDGSAVPDIARPSSSVFISDARRGIAHLGFDNVFSQFVETAHEVGVAVFSQHSAYTCGALGYFVERLARCGLTAFATANAPAAVAASGTSVPVFGTNPMAFAAPRLSGAPVVIDQASSATALVNVRRAIATGEALPDGWALDVTGVPTNSPDKALKGSLLPFGGRKGSNLALMVEILSTLSGAKWSVDAPPFTSGSDSPEVGMFVLGMATSSFGENATQRLSEHMDRLKNEYHAYIPGLRKREDTATLDLTELLVDSAALAAVRAVAESA